MEKEKFLLESLQMYESEQKRKSLREEGFRGILNGEIVLSPASFFEIFSSFEEREKTEDLQTKVLGIFTEKQKESLSKNLFEKNAPQFVCFVSTKELKKRKGEF